MAVKNTVRVWATASGKQSFETDITTPSDPTGVTPKFGLTVVDDLDGPASWTAGAWSGSYDTTTEKTTAVTPTVGATSASPSLTVASGNRYWLWAQVTLGGEVWTEPVGEIHVP
jgi:hypothetical protein